MVITQYQTYDDRIIQTLCAKFLLFDQKIVPQLSKSLEGGIFYQSHSDAQSKNIWRETIALMVNPDLRCKQKCMYLAFFVAEVDQNVTQADHACEVAEF